MKKFLLLIIPLVNQLALLAQHEHMDMRHDSMPVHEHMDHMSTMTHAYSLNLPMNRNGSGTSWLPDATSMYGAMLHTKKWMYMFHGNIFIRYNNQDIGNVGSRGGSRWDAPNMLMAMGQTKIGQRGLFHFNTMLSFDALITGGSGYPLLFQTGESWQGKPLVDRQHPHDLFSELSVSYSYSFSKSADAFIYIGYPGEPAIGPAVFMRRPSGMDIPDAPIGHHWTDATHITFGVATIGFRFGQFKLEGSSFTGREPDENRYNFDQPKFDSWSSRLSFNPSDNWALQVSHAFIKSPEALRPEEDIYRTTASATFVKPLSTEEKYLSATALWGMNKQPGQDASNSALLETVLRIKKLVAYLRYEWVQKSAEELDLGAFEPGTLFSLNVVTIGEGYDIYRFAFMRLMLGGQLAWNRPDSRLYELYGKNPLSLELYLRVYFSRMR